jgi:hypothetical protein
MGFHPRTYILHCSIIIGYLYYTVLCIVAVNGEPDGASTSMASEGASPLITVSEGALRIECPNEHPNSSSNISEGDQTSQYGFQ